jgi:hypothetical protein
MNERLGAFCILPLPRVPRMKEITNPPSAEKIARRSSGFLGLAGFFEWGIPSVLLLKFTSWLLL